MNILFICGCLEPGKDGVGDYCRVLGESLVSKGNSVFLVALNDPYVQGITEATSTLRLPSGVPRCAIAKQVLDFATKREIGCVSFHYVPYAYAAKGLPFWLIPLLGDLRLVAELRHLMLHETWVSIEHGVSYKHLILGWLQKQILKSSISHWKPCTIHTSNPTYASILESQGIQSQILPLFSNIQHLKGCTGFQGFEAIGISPDERKHCFIAGVFGNVPDQWNPLPLFESMNKHCLSQGLRMIVVFFGKNNQAPAYFARLQQNAPHEVLIKILGERDPGAISWLIDCLDVGLATTPMALIGKSGAAVAMRDHGVPVVVTRTDWKTRYPVPSRTPELPPHVYPFDTLGTTWCWADIKRFTPDASIETVTMQWLDSLSILPQS